MIEEPTRIEADPGTPEPLRELFRAARGDGLEAAAVVRVGEALSRAGGGSSPPPATGASSFRAWGLGLGGTAVIVAAIVLGRAPAHEPTPVEPTVAEATVRDDVEAGARFEPPPSTIAAIARDDAGAPAAVAPAKRGSTRPPKEPATDDAAAAMPEAALLLQARRALRRDPARTLALTTTHGNEFPQSALAQERESLAILALVGLGRKAAAAARAERFFAKFPSSPHEDKIRRALSGAADPFASEDAAPGDTNPP